jgi:hypothetical protein
MKFAKYMRKSLFLLLLDAFMSGCSTQQSELNPPDTTGYILDIKGNSLLVAERITSEEYDEIKYIPIDELVDKENLYLIYLIYDDVKDLKKGNKIEVWLEGEEMEASNPAKAKAKNIELKE